MSVLVMVGVVVMSDPTSTTQGLGVVPREIERCLSSYTQGTISTHHHQTWDSIEKTWQWC